jgi:hypothetical protein
MRSFNVFKPFTMKWWQAGIFKIAMLSLGLLIGSTWPEFFAPWRAALCIVFIVCAGYLTYLWWNQ